MTIARFVVLIFAMFMAGCDPVYGPPSVQNKFSTNIEINIIFADGDTNKLVLPPCKAFALGGVGRRSKINIGVKQILISKDGEIIHTINADQATALIQKQKEHTGFSVWTIGSDGIKFITTPLAIGCTSK